MTDVIIETMFKILKFLTIAVLFFVFTAALLVGYARYIEPYRLISTEMTIVNNADGSAGRVTVAVFADTHFSDIYTPLHFNKAIDMINSKNPDIILFCGDLIDNFNSYDGELEAITSALSRLSAPLGKFAVYGNHDYGGGGQRAFEDIMTGGGFKILKNESVEFGDIGLVLIGLDDFVLGYGDSGFVQESAKPGWFNFVFCHEPDIVDELLGYSVDFMVAAHTHGGQINIPGHKHAYFPPYGQKYLMGVYSFENASQTVLYVNSGIATTQMPYRFMARPEVTFIHLD